MVVATRNTSTVHWRCNSITLVFGYIRSLQKQANFSGLTANATELEAEVIKLRRMLKGTGLKQSEASVLSALRTLLPGAFTDDKDGVRLSEIYAFVNGAEVIRAAEKKEAAVAASNPLEPAALVEEI